MLAYVIGSGPSGVSVAKALLSQGHKVVMLDYSNAISKERQKDIEQIKSNVQCDNSVLNKIKYSIGKDIPDKLAYAENYPYEDGLKLLKIVLSNCGLRPSLATGGLSNVWGASVLSFHENDINDWPITTEDLAPHYAAVGEFMQISAKTDDLAFRYPLYAKSFSPKISPQVQQFYEQLNFYRNHLNQEGLIFGFSRNAYNASECNECSLCMWGCPYNFIYNSKDTLQTLILHPEFKYVSDTLVEKFEDNGSTVLVHALNRDRQQIIFYADKIFIANGVLSTAKLVLTSLKYYKPIILKDTPYFIAPLINRKLKGDYVEKVKHNTLSQLFIEVNDVKISNNTVHLQIYPYNEMLLELFKSKFKKLFILLYPLIKFILNKTVIVQGYFHSNDGNDLEIQLLPSGELQVTGYDHVVDKKINLLIRKFKKFGVIPLYEKAMPGRSFHCGGTFPMVVDTSKIEDRVTVDRTGLVAGTKNVHIVDASILPSIPAQTITYTVMANAHRIGSLFKSDTL